MTYKINIGYGIKNNKMIRMVTLSKIDLLTYLKCRSNTQIFLYNDKEQTLKKSQYFKK